MGFNPYEHERKETPPSKEPFPYTVKAYAPPANPNSLCEAFNWYTKEFNTYDVGKDRIRLKIVSAKAGAISKNGRQYVEEALIKSCNTWTGRPICVNHDINAKIGTVELTEFEDNQLEHIAVITKQPYVDLFRNKSKEIKGFSLGANYIYLRCAVSKCNQKFLSEEEWQTHMAKEHFVKDLPKQPHGILGQEISLVFGREEPGLETSWEIAETTKGFTKLCETVLSERGLDPSTVAAPTTPTAPTVDPITENLALIEKAPEPYHAAFKLLIAAADKSVLEWKAKAEQTPAVKEQQRLVKETYELQKAKAAEPQLVETLTTQNKTLQETLAKLEADKKTLTEQVEAKNKKLVEYENVIDKVQAKFKGVAKKTVVNRDPPISTFDPYDPIRRNL